MAISMRSKLASPVARSAPRAAVVVRAEKGNQAVQLAAASVLSAIALLTAASADAKVIIAQPQLKKSFFDATEAVKRAAPTVGIPGSARSAPSVSSPAAAKPRVADSNSEGGIDPRIISLPGAIVAIGGLGFLATKVDPGVSEWFDDVIVKSNIDDGVGYEPVLKPSDGQLKPAAGVYAAGSSGSKKAQATKKGPSVAGGLGAFFGKEKK